MEKELTRWCYLLGLLCFVIALAWRALGALGIGPEYLLKSVNYMSFYKGSLLLLVVSIATANYAGVMSQKS